MLRQNQRRHVTHFNTFHKHIFRTLLIANLVFSAVVSGANLPNNADEAQAGIGSTEEDQLSAVVRRVMAENSKQKFGIESEQTSGGPKWSREALHEAARTGAHMVKTIVSESLPEFLLFLAIVILAALGAYASPTLIRFVGRQWINRSYLRLFSWLIGILILVLGFGLGLGVNHLNLWNILLAFGIVGLIVSQGFNGLLSNIISGIMLCFDPEVDIGNEISIAGMRGRVIAMDIRAVTLERTDIPPPDGAAIDYPRPYTFVPNRHFSEEPVTLHLQSQDGLNALAQRSGWNVRESKKTM
jgi:small-conductance mechanosensitive channel